MRNIDVREKRRSVASFVCPDQELNLQPSTLRDDAQPTEPHQSGPVFVDLIQKMIPSS